MNRTATRIAGHGHRTGLHRHARGAGPHLRRRPAPVEITVRVSEKGFSDEKATAYTAKNLLKIPHGTPVTITFVFSEEMTSLAVGDTHQIAIKSDNGWKEETEKLWLMSRQGSITFRAGEHGQTQYRAYCMLDCIGMEHLTNLVIQVV